MTSANPLPAHLRQYVTEAIASGLRDPEEILKAAIEKCDNVAAEMVAGQTRRARLARHTMMLETYGRA